MRFRCLRGLIDPVAFAALLASLACSRGSIATGSSKTGADDSGDTTGDVDPSDELFDPAVVQTFELEITDTDRQAMFDALPERIYVPAQFTWNDITIENIGARFKGNSSSGPNSSHKRSYLLKFNEYVPGQQFLGLRRLALDNGIQFGSLFSERLLTDVLRELGITTMRSNHCRLMVNGRYEGVYVNVERIDKSFLERYFADASGPLFKVDEGGPGANLVYLGDDPMAYGVDDGMTRRETFETKSEAADAGIGPVIDLMRMLAETSDEAVVDVLPQAFDLDQFIPLMAVMALGGAFDQYTGWGAHNYYLYFSPDTGQWRYLAWDLDVGFADDAFGEVPVLDQWNAAYPYPIAGRPLLAKLLDNEMWLAQYRATADPILEQYFHPDVIVPKLLRMYDLVEPHLADDPFPHVRATNPEDTDYESIVASLEAFMRARYDKGRAELDDPTDTPPDDPDTGPEPGDPSPQDPTNLRVDSPGPGGVALAWDDNAPDERLSVLQRCTGAGCSDFVNHIGQDMEDVTTVIDTGVIPGTTYRYRVYVVRPVQGMPVGTGPSNVVEVTAS